MLAHKYKICSRWEQTKQDNIFAGSNLTDSTRTVWIVPCLLPCAFRQMLTEQPKITIAVENRNITIMTKFLQQKAIKIKIKKSQDKELTFDFSNKHNERNL